MLFRATFVIGIEGHVFEGSGDPVFARGASGRKGSNMLAKVQGLLGREGGAAYGRHRQRSKEILQKPTIAVLRGKP